jgi:hypothetical protein
LKRLEDHPIAIACADPLLNMPASHTRIFVRHLPFYNELTIDLWKVHHLGQETQQQLKRRPQIHWRSDVRIIFHESAKGSRDLNELLHTRIIINISARGPRIKSPN